jgi:hypothetical protein
MKKKTKKNTMRYVRAMTVPRKIPFLMSSFGTTRSRRDVRVRGEYWRVSGREVLQRPMDGKLRLPARCSAPTARRQGGGGPAVTKLATAPPSSVMKARRLINPSSKGGRTLKRTFRQDVAESRHQELVT